MTDGCGLWNGEMSQILHALRQRTNLQNALSWSRRNLFAGPFNTLLTVLSVVLVFVSLRAMLRWALFSANWDPVTYNLRLFMVGQYPQSEVWRIGAIVWLASFFMGVTWGRFGGSAATFGRAVAIGLGLLAFLPVSREQMSLAVRLWLIANPALVASGYWAGRTVFHRGRWLLLGWVLFPVAATVLVAGLGRATSLPRVESGLWGGLLLTFILAVVGILASFPIGVLLALGRRSTLPLVRLLCTLFIEIVRGVPLVTILFMASILLPLFLPEQIRIDRVVRAMLGMTLFASAYMAENVRGGLAAIPSGQYEAAKAVGLNGILTMALIILPQALRTVIPAIVGQFIALFMDTTLAVIVGLLELLAVGKAVVQGNPQWLSRQAEVYLFIAAVFWVFTFSMSFASRRLEATLGVGKR
jgi:general L-amino acid transport system permease protein